METTDFEDVLREAAGEAGADADNISVVEFLTWRRFAKRRLEIAWRHHYWPDLGRCEQRYYRLAYDPATTYSQALAGVDNSANEVWWALTGQYFVALQSTTANAPTDANGVVDLAHWAVTQQYDRTPVAPGAPFDLTATFTQGDRVLYAGNVYQLFAATATGILPTDGTAWGLVPPFNATVPYEQTGQTAFTVVEECYSANPETTTRGITLDWKLTNKGVNVLSRIAAPWIQFRLRCPKLSGVAFDSSRSYPAGQAAYYSNAATGLLGNFYTATVTTTAGDTPESAPTKWAVVQIPRLFHRYLVLGMAADWQKYVVGTNPEAEPQSQGAEALAQMELDDCKSLYVGQMGQRVQTQVRTR